MLRPSVEEAIASLERLAEREGMVPAALSELVRQQRAATYDVQAELAGAGVQVGLGVWGGGGRGQVGLMRAGGAGRGLMRTSGPRTRTERVCLAAARPSGCLGGSLALR